MSNSSTQSNEAPLTVAVTFVEPDGKSLEVAASLGGTLMEAAVDAGVQGILAECGGGCSCGTCHVILEAADFDRMGDPNPLESGILDFADNAGDYSRLSCQMDVTEAMNGMTFKVGE